MKSLFPEPLLGLVMLVMGLGLLVCCTKRPIDEYSELTLAAAIGEAPRSLAVLPFENRISSYGLEDLVRKSFYSHLSVRPYRDVELHIVDTRIRKYLQDTNRTWSEISPKELGKLLACDAVIYGEVNEYQRVFAGIYSQMAVGASISIWDTRSGQLIWSDQHIVRYHEGGVPLSPLDLPLISLRSGMNMRDIVKTRLVDELTRYLARRIPSPQKKPYGWDEETIYGYEIQVGAFLDGGRAIHLIAELSSRGYPVFMRSDQEEGGRWYRVIVGPYEHAEEAFQIEKKIQEITGVKPFSVRVPLKPDQSATSRK